MSDDSSGKSVCMEADGIVSGARQGDYGHPYEVYSVVGRIWGAMLGITDIPADKVCLMMAGLKVGRESVRHKRDNLVDICGYAKTVEMVHDHKGVTFTWTIDNGKVGSLR